VKRLAVHVEDHPLDYRSFEGKIPAGEYGAGAVIVWDEGSWVPEGDDPAAPLARGALNFDLPAAPLTPRCALVRLRRGDRKNWPLLKENFAYAPPSHPPRPLMPRPRARARGHRRPQCQSRSQRQCQRRRHPARWTPCARDWRPVRAVPPFRSEAWG